MNHFIQLFLVALAISTGPLAQAGDALDSTLQCKFQGFTVYLWSVGVLRTGQVMIIPDGKAAITVPSASGAVPNLPAGAKITNVVYANSWLDLNGEELLLINKADTNPTTNPVFYLKLKQKPVGQAAKGDVADRDEKEEASKIVQSTQNPDPNAPNQKAPADPNSMKMVYEGKIKFDFQADGYQGEAKQVVCTCGDLSTAGSSAKFSPRDCKPNIPGGG